MQIAAASHADLAEIDDLEARGPQGVEALFRQQRSTSGRIASVDADVGGLVRIDRAGVADAHLHGRIVARSLVDQAQVADREVGHAERIGQRALLHAIGIVGQPGGRLDQRKRRVLVDLVDMEGRRTPGRSGIRPGAVPGLEDADPRRGEGKVPVESGDDDLGLLVAVEVGHHRHFIDRDRRIGSDEALDQRARIKNAQVVLIGVDHFEQSVILEVEDRRAGHARWIVDVEGAFDRAVGLEHGELVQTRNDDFRQPIVVDVGYRGRAHGREIGRMDRAPDGLAGVFEQPQLVVDRKDDFGEIIRIEIANGYITRVVHRHFVGVGNWYRLDVVSVPQGAAFEIVSRATGDDFHAPIEIDIGSYRSHGPRHAKGRTDRLAAGATGVEFALPELLAGEAAERGPTQDHFGFVVAFEVDDDRLVEDKGCRRKYRRRFAWAVHGRTPLQGTVVLERDQLLPIATHDNDLGDTVIVDISGCRRSKLGKPDIGPRPEFRPGATVERDEGGLARRNAVAQASHEDQVRCVVLIDHAVAVVISQLYDGGRRVERVDLRI